MDSDGDLIPDACDPCPATADPDYDVSVTPDADEDGIPDRCDNCPTVLNPRTMVGNTLVQSDLDGDQIGDACDWCTDPANPIPDPCPQGLICPSLIDFWRFRDELVSPILDPSQIRDVLDLAFVPSRTIPTIKDALEARDLDTINILRDPRIGDVWQVVPSSEGITLLSGLTRGDSVLEHLIVNVQTGQVEGLTRHWRDRSFSAELLTAGHYTIQLPASLDLERTAVVAFDSLKVNDGVEFSKLDGSRPALANLGSGTTNIGVEARVGPVLSRANLEIRNRAELAFAETEGTATVAVDANLTLPPDEGVDLAVGPAIVALAAPDPGLDVDDQFITGTKTLVPGAYGALNLGNGGQVTLTSGNYSVRSLLAEPQSVLRIDDSAGPVGLYIRDSFIFRGTISSANGNNFSQVLFAYLGTGAAHFESSFKGALFAPHAHVNFATHQQGHRGSFFAKSLEFHQNTDIIHIPFDWAGLRPTGNELPLPRPGHMVQGAATPTGPGSIPDENGMVLSGSRQQLFVFGSGSSDNLNTTVWVYSLAQQAWIESTLTEPSSPVVCLHRRSCSPQTLPKEASSQACPISILGLRIRVAQQRRTRQNRCIIRRAIPPLTGGISGLTDILRPITTSWMAQL